MSFSSIRTDVMMREIEEQLFDAEEDVRLGKHAEFDQLAQEPANLQLRLDVDLVLLPNMPPAIKDSSNQIKSVLRIRIRDPVLFRPLVPDPGSGIRFCRISDPESQTHMSECLVTIVGAKNTLNSKYFFCTSSFLLLVPGSEIRYGKKLGSGINILDPQHCQ